jgi:hypothetical protein
MQRGDKFFGIYSGIFPLVAILILEPFNKLTATIFSGSNINE